jgi:hypothetical protein
VTRLGADGAPPDVRPRLVVPAYFHPAIHEGQWEWLAEHAAEVRLVILNIASGPGAGPDPAFLAPVERLRRAGVAVAGYVDTDYGRRPLEQAVADVGRYLDWYGVDGVCFDRAAVAAEHVAHYATLAARARAMGAESVLFNHGAYPLESYADHADLLGTFEGPWPAYRHLSVPRWTATRAADKFYHVVYAVPPERFDDALALAVGRRSAAVYITDRSGPNPYDQLPAGADGPPRPGQDPPRPGPDSERTEMTGNHKPAAAGNRRRRAHRSPWWRRGPVMLAAIVLIAAAGAVAGTTRLLPDAVAPICQRAFIPAFFSPGSGWTQAANSKPPPSIMILDVTDTGAGSSPDAGLQAAVKHAQAAGVRILGYAATDYGKRSAAQVEADVRNYQAWYGVTSIFLDQAATATAQIGYYRALAGYIRQVDHGAVVWLNPGIYPDERYMSVADVVMVFEGSYASYRNLRVPGWAGHYPPAKFAHTIYATPGPQLASAVRLSGSGHAGYVFITDRSGANPYGGLPAYWSREDVAVTAGCPRSGA